MSIRKRITNLANKAQASIEASGEARRARDAEFAAKRAAEKRAAEEARQARRQEWETAIAEGPKRLADVAMKGAGLIVIITPLNETLDPYDLDGAANAISSALGLDKEGGGAKSLAISAHDHPFERTATWEPAAGFAGGLAEEISERTGLTARRQEGRGPTVISPNSSVSADSAASRQFSQAMNRGVDAMPLAAGIADAVQTGHDVLNDFHGHNPADVGHISMISSISYKELGIPGVPIGDSGSERPPNPGNIYAFTGLNPDTGDLSWRQIHPNVEPPN